MRANAFNLARRPFANQAPVLRVGLLLALLAAVLLFLNVQRYRNYFAGRGEQARTQITEIDRRIESLDQELAGLQHELAQYDVAAINEQAEFLNLRIRERTFDWSRLFQDLEAVTPVTVRLERLSPNQVVEEGNAGEVLLSIAGVAQTEEGLLDFVDALFAHERFRSPNPSNRSERENGHSFRLNVSYLPPGQDPPSGASGLASAKAGS